MAEKPTLMVIGPTPPPHHGVSMATQMLLTSSLAERFRLVHLDTADRRGIQHVDQPDLYDLFLFARQWIGLLRWLLRERPQMTYLPISQSTIGFLRDSFFVWPAYWFGSRIILHLHGGNFRAWYEKQGGWVKGYVRFVLRRTARVVVLGESLKILFQDLVAPGKISVVPNGIDWARQAGSPSETAAPKRRDRILHLSTLNRLKGALVLIQAIPMVLKARRDVEFVFAGAWSRLEDRKETESFILKHDLADHVRFTGHLEGAAKRALFESSDLFVFPGVQQEGQPLVVIEAMAAGLPVLFTARGCLRETVIDGENGLEVGLNDPEDLAKKMIWMLNHPEEMKMMGLRSRRRYEAFYTGEQFIQNMIHVLNQVAGENA